MESEFTEKEGVSMDRVLRDIVVDREQVKLLEKLKVNKASNPDGVSNWILRECSGHNTKLYRKIIKS